jgi:hypothetical protein
MKFRSLIPAAAAVSLMATPVLASASSADLGRTVAPVAGESGIENNTILYIVGGILAAVGLIFLIDGSDNDDNPASP